MIITDESLLRVECEPVLSSEVDYLRAKLENALEWSERNGHTGVGTLRYREIVVEGNLVRPYKFVATGFAAVVIQHEIDHLNGILLPDVAIAK